MIRYSLLINWNDNDRDEGTYSWSGLASSATEAEEFARDAMRESSTPPLDDGEEVGGSVVDTSMGAAWAAWELEKALTALIDAVDEHVAKGLWHRDQELEDAKKVIAGLSD